MKRLFALTLVIGGLVTSAVVYSPPAADSSPSPLAGTAGVMAVYVVNDLNENGAWDDGEPGLEGWSVYAKGGDVIYDKATTDADGRAAFEEKQPKQGLDPSIEFGWRLTAGPLHAEGEEQAVVYLARHVGEDVAYFLGLLVVDGLPASSGAQIEAWVDGEICGDAQIEPRLGITRYSMYVLGAGERQECADEGALVTFTVSGVYAGEGEFASRGHRSLDLIAGPEPMLLSLSSFTTPSVSGLVTPRIGSQQCGVSYRYLAAGPVAPNWQQVYVRAAQSQKGCGAEGAVVSLWSGDHIDAQVMWEPWWPSPLRIFGDADCDGEVGSVDAAIVLQNAAGLLGSVKCEAAGDANQNGALDAVDAALLLQRAAELIEWFPAA